jgi:DNA gyrase subunit A
MINKAEMIRKIADLINEKKIEGISYINDESDRHGTRIVIILKKEAVANVVLNNLFKLTPLQSSFPINSIALVDGRPKLLGLKDMIRLFVKHRHNVIIRRTQFELEQAEKRAHILEGLLIAIDNIDEVIDIIRNAQTPDEAKDKLMERFSLSEIQSRAIIDMRLRSLTGLEREKVKEEHAELLKYIDYCKQVLSDESLQMKIIKDELIEVKAKYGDARRTEIVPNEEEFNPEDFYADEDVVITISHLGYIKRTPLTEYRLQARGGVGVKGSTTRDEDFIEHLYIASMHNTMLFFTENGKCYWLKVYEIPEGTKGSKGRAIQNLINIEPEDKVKAYINVKKFNDPDYVSNNFIILCTKKGIIKKTSLEAYSRPRQNGVIAITIKDGDQLLEASLTDGQSHLLLATKGGKAIRFPEQLVRPIGRTASGVRGISIGKGDEVIGMVCVNKDEETEILVVSEKGFGKRSVFDDYPVTNRGGKGVKTINITEKTGKLIAVKGVNDNDDLMIINRSGITIRLSVSQIRLSARATQGVKLISLRNGDSIASVDKVETNEEIDESQSAENMLSNESTE